MGVGGAGLFMSPIIVLADQSLEKLASNLCDQDRDCVTALAFRG